ncbi:MAG: DUF3014 domain-containing protein [Gammaproteobacteria bacterium]|nr:DUF3014 domain-containing protein [Gammaproteobacteria bacterium]
MSKNLSKTVVLILLAAILAGALWIFRNDIRPLADKAVVAPAELAVVEPEPVNQETLAQSGPIHPVEPSGPAEPLQDELPVLPGLDESDSEILQALIRTFGPDVERVLVSQSLIDKFVATVDNLPDRYLAEKIRPVAAHPEAFAVDPAADEEYFYLSPTNYKRYDPAVNLVTAVDLNKVAAMYRRYYPLFQESYVRLGYPKGYFNDRVVEVIDHLLETPEVEEPVLLVRPHVLYRFADPELEALSSGQKILIRMGAEHESKIKQVLEDLRALIVQSSR